MTEGSHQTHSYSSLAANCQLKCTLPAPDILYHGLSECVMMAELALSPEARSGSGSRPSGGLSRSSTSWGPRTHSSTEPVMGSGTHGGSGACPAGEQSRSSLMLGPGTRGGLGAYPRRKAEVVESSPRVQAYMAARQSD
jgi:hypothetical protein